MSELVFYQHPKKDFSKEKPKNLVIFLHGYGANGANLIELAHEFERVLPNSCFISPNAPQNWEGGFPDCYQWFSLAAWGLDRNVEKVSQGVIEASKTLQEFINAQLKRLDLTPKNLFLVGFSQGAMMAMYQGFITKESFAGIVAYSGKLILPEMIGQTSLSEPDICLVHGRSDSVVPFENFLLSEEIMKKQGLNFESHSFEGLDHSIDIRGIRVAMEYVKKKLQSS
jgi:phospholipase/carboxylesterase